LVIPEFPFIVFNLSIPIEGVTAYDAKPDYEKAAKLGIAAAALTFLILTVNQAPPTEIPEPTNPIPDAEPVPQPGQPQPQPEPEPEPVPVG
jgi:hypothetical protein